MPCYGNISQVLLNIMGRMIIIYGHRYFMENILGLKIGYLHHEYEVPQDLLS